MKTISDAKDFSTDSRFSGFILLIIASIILVVLPMFLIVSPPAIFVRAFPVVIIGSAGALIVLLMLGIYLKGRGMLFKLPMKVYDEGMMVQPVFSIKPKVIPYEEIVSLEFWYGLGYKKAKSGCSVLSSNGSSVASVENFKDKQSLKNFVEGFRNLLDQKGIKLKSADEEADSLIFVFHRDVGKKRAVPVRLV